MENKKIYDFINKHTDKHIDEKELENVTGAKQCGSLPMTENLIPAQTAGLLS